LLQKIIIKSNVFSGTHEGRGREVCQIHPHPFRDGPQKLDWELAKGEYSSQEWSYTGYTAPQS
jgi:hypothetical protein